MNSNINSSKRHITDDFIENGNDTDDKMDDLDESSDEEDMTGDENEAERQTRTEVVTQDELGRSTIFLRLIRDMEEQ